MITRYAAATAATLIASALIAGPVAAAEPADILETYANIAQAGYQDSLTTANSLKAAIDTLIETPSDATLAAARVAWVTSRVPYQQTEAYRFGNVAVDEWEGKVNAWPLDEGLIDYVDQAQYGGESDENAFYAANLIASEKLTVAGREIDASDINPDLLRKFHEVDEVESNVATGYHAIEFLLWGQDLNGTGPGAGNRQASDFMSGDACTGGRCDRRAAYLTAATDLLISDLEEMVSTWGDDGAARLALGDSKEGLGFILTGLGSLSYGELAGERMQLGLMLHDPEEEHDCFSDNTHNSHYYDALGISNVYRGSYTRIDGTIVTGASLSDFMRELAPELDAEMTAKLDATQAAMSVLKQTADDGTMAYDQMIGEGNEAGNAIVQAAIDGLVDQTRTIERIVAAIELNEISIEGSDSLDNPGAVFQ
ncbi:MAG: peptidase [Rhodobiaceae bacterium]|nr:MAG: peptidase [Rhodobiaceae bacterium]